MYKVYMIGRRYDSQKPLLQSKHLASCQIFRLWDGRMFGYNKQLG